MASRRARGEGTIRKRADGRWEARVTLGGKRRSVFGHTQAEARDKLREAIVAGARGLPYFGAGPRLSEWLPIWLAAAEPALRPRTVEGYQSAITIHISPRLGRLRLQELQPHHVEAFLHDLSADGLTAKSMKNIHGVLRRALTIAERQGYVARNAARLVSPPKVEHSEVQPLTLAEVATFLEHARPHRLYSLYVTAMATGLRAGELLAPRWADLDLEERSLAVRRTLHRRAGAFHFAEPKSRTSRRVLALPEPLAVELRAHRDRQTWERERAGALWQGAEWGDLTFTTEFGGPMASYVATKTFQRLLAAAGVRRVRLHDLRHGAATYLLTAGIDLKTVSVILGHSSIQITADVYGHIEPELKREAADRLGTAIFGS